MALRPATIFGGLVVLVAVVDVLVDVMCCSCV